MKLSANYVKNMLDTHSSLNGHEGVVTILLDNTADINEHKNGGVSPIYVSLDYYEHIHALNLNI